MLLSFSACDLLSEWLNREKEPEKQEDVESYIKSSNLASGYMLVTLYSIEDGNNPEDLYAYFDQTLYVGDIDKWEFDGEGGASFYYLADANQEEEYYFKESDLKIYFSDDFHYIDSLFLFNTVFEKYFIDQTSREMSFKYEVYNPVPIVTPDVDSIWENGKVEYLQEFTNENDYKFECVEVYGYNGETSDLNYKDTQGEHRFLKVYFEFRVW